MLALLMAPANRVCDVLGMTDEHERAMVRMLVNTTLATTVLAVVFFAVWMLVV
jgi:hypothetical protein